ncbi:MAG TPA: arsenite methyltransferase [Coriobacteriia bacterium]|nr:arsenite methyltransferase [Coriobacteriia bacterium]
MNAGTESLKDAVRDRYAGHAQKRSSCCSCSCGTDSSSADFLDYDAAELAELPLDADLGLGCGNPLALQSVSEGDFVVDLGSGGGIDCFLAARRTGRTGRVIGVDMTAEMVRLARRNAERGGFDNVEFRLGEVEDLPIDDNTADLIISNCVINLVPDKHRAFAEAFRVLKPGGRLSVSDIVTTEPLPRTARSSVAAYVACLGGAATLDDYVGAARSAGFTALEIVSNAAYAMEEGEAEALLSAYSRVAPPEIGAREARRIAGLFRSVTLQASKPRDDA